MFAIDHLHVRASQTDTQAVVNDLKYGSWAVFDQDAWVFIRGINIEAKKNVLRQNASQAVNQALTEAVDGRLDSAVSANVVKFSDLVELLTFLIKDLLQHKAAQRWYWKRWSYLFLDSPALAVTRVLWEQTEYLPSLISSLIKHNLLAATWDCLTPESATVILKKFCAEKTIAPPHPYAEAGQIDLVVEQAALNVFEREYRALNYWQPVLNGISRNDSRTTLAMLQVCLRYCPSLLNKSPSSVARAFNKNINTLLAKETSELNVKPINKSSIVDTPDTVKKIDSENSFLRYNGKTVDQNGFVKNNELMKAKKVNAGFSEIIKDSIPSENVFLAKNDSNNNERTSRPSRSQVEELKQEALSEVNEKNEAQESELLGHTFTTSNGGMFYLINALSQSNEFETYTNEAEVFNAWFCLYDLTRCFNHNLDDNLLQFIADQVAVDDIAALKSISPLPVSQDIFQRLSQRYRHHGIFTDNLIQVRSTVIATASHIDVVFPLSAVQLPIRLAGLDVNPGWVPCLGRVFSFHYRDSTQGILAS